MRCPRSANKTWGSPSRPPVPFLFPLSFSLKFSVVAFWGKGFAREGLGRRNLSEECSAERNLHRKVPFKLTNLSGNPPLAGERRTFMESRNVQAICRAAGDVDRYGEELYGHVRYLARGDR